jgi:hypothetical protein
MDVMDLVCLTYGVAMGQVSMATAGALGLGALVTLGVGAGILRGL